LPLRLVQGPRRRHPHDDEAPPFTRDLLISIKRMMMG
jgi:hypothetical protein